MWNEDFSSKTTMENKIKSELVSELAKELGIEQGDSEKLFNQILSSSLHITAPVHKVESPRMDMIIFRENGPIGGQGATYKPGNIRFNLTKLVNPVSDGGLAVASALTGEPWIIACTVLKVLYNVTQSMKIELSSTEGFIIETISRYQNQGKNAVEYDTLFEGLNTYLTRIRQDQVSADEFERAVENLTRIKVILETSKGYKLIEYTTYSYR